MIVEITFESGDGSEQASYRYEVRDFAEHRAAVDSGQHDGIIRQVTPAIRNEIGLDARYLSTTVDGVVQPAR